MKDALLNYVKKVKAVHERVRGNEQATKAGLIGPLFTLLGYDLADPLECFPEFKADFGKNRARTPVDWAFYQNGTPIFLVEAKEAGSKLDGYDEQLASYFAQEPAVKLGILTNGVMWQFYTDLVHQNLMDKEPFVAWDVLHDEAPPHDFLTLLQKSQFKAELIRTFAQRRYKHNLLVNELGRLLEPSAEFTRLAIANIETRNPTADVVESWKPIVAGAIGEWAKQRAIGIAVSNPSWPKEVSSSTHPKKGLKAPQVRILKALAEAGRPLDRKAISKLAPCHSQLVIEYIGGSVINPEREARRGWKRLIPLGFVEASQRTIDGKSRRMFEITPAGREALASVHAPSCQQEEKDTSTDPDRYRLRKKFWAELVSRPKARSTRHANIAPSKHSWISAGSGVRGVSFMYFIRQQEGQVELYIDRGQGQKQENKRIFDLLHSHKREIEQSFGAPLVWRRLDGKQACRIAYIMKEGAYKTDESRWSAIHDAMIDAMMRLENAFAPHLKNLKTELASQGG